MGEALKSPRFFSSGLRSFVRSVGSLVLPDRCVGCGSYLAPATGAEPLETCFCRPCLCLPLPRFSPPFCPCCGHLFEDRSQENHLCEACLRSRPGITTVRAAFAYEGIIRSAVTQFKYKGRLRLANPLSMYLFDSFERYFSMGDIDLILPIPLHPARAWDRQFNQAVLLVRHFSGIFSRRLGQNPPWEVRTDLLLRRRATVSQTGLDQKAREKNLKGAFAVRAESGVKGKRVLLVDDVYTSGATCRAAAACLFRAGARQVDVLVVARA